MIPGTVKEFLHQALRRVGIDIVRYPAPLHLPDFSLEQLEIISKVRPYTMTSIERLVALLKVVGYIVENQIPGDIAECGVWRGGSMMTVALALLLRGDRSRDLYLYDTFEGMPPPTEHDRSFHGTPAEVQLKETPAGTGIWCYAGLEDVRTNLLSTGYPVEKIHFIRGKVEETIPQTVPAKLSLLRLDTDWYESTRHELVHLYPILSRAGCLIIDDYGAWQGARKAVDEYFGAMGQPVYLHRIDYTGRLMIKSGS